MPSRSSVVPSVSSPASMPRTVTCSSRRSICAGGFREPHLYWDAATGAPSARLRGDLEILPTLAEAGLVRAGKDISMAGLVGTAMMLCESSRRGVCLDLDAIPLSSRRPARSFSAGLSELRLCVERASRQSRCGAAAVHRALHRLRGSRRRRLHAPRSALARRRGGRDLGLRSSVYWVRRPPSRGPSDACGRFRGAPGRMARSRPAIRHRRSSRIISKSDAPMRSPNFSISAAKACTPRATGSVCDTVDPVVPMRWRSSPPSK